MKYTTKYFGEISIDETKDFEFINVVYNNETINISLSDCNSYGDKIKLCIEVLDKYLEINETAKKKIIENYYENETVKYYFECHFDILEQPNLIRIFGTDEFENLKIDEVVKNMKNPNLLFSLDNGKIEISVDYKISEEYSDEILCVKMDENLNVIDFSHES